MFGEDCRKAEEFLEFAEEFEQGRSSIEDVNFGGCRVRNGASVD